MFRKEGRHYVAYYCERGRELVGIYQSRRNAAANARPGDVITKVVGPYPGEGWHTLRWVKEANGGLREIRAIDATGRTA